MNRTKLEQTGWEKRGVFDEPRLSEVCEMYRELGFELLLMDYGKEEDGSCTGCFEGSRPETYKVVYTKKHNPASSSQESE